MGIEATQFVTSSGRQVLTNDGQQGMGEIGCGIDD